jgi:general secretion pathway protein F
MKRLPQIFGTFRRRATRHQLLAAVSRLHSLMSAGLAPAEALAAGAEAGGAAGALLAGVAAWVRRGDSLSGAMNRMALPLGAAELALVTAGERSGRVARAIELLVERMEATSRDRKKIVQAFLYPCVLLSVTTLVVIAVATLVLPAFTDIYVQTGRPLPGSTRTLMSLADFALRSGPQALLVLIGLLAAATWMHANVGLAADAIDRATLGLPLVGRLVAAADRGRFYRTLAALLEAGLDLDAALALAAPTVSNRVLRGRCLRVHALVRNGVRLSAALRRSTIDPTEHDASLLRIAEATGDYAGAFARLAAIAAERREATLTTVVRLAEPCAVLGVAAAVGATVVAVYQPIIGSAASLAGGLR